jgi:hypothetical protein
VYWQWGEIKTGGIWSMLVDGGMVLVLGQDASGDASGDRQNVVRGSIWCAGACAVISGVIVSPTGIYWLRTGSINSFPLVLVLVLVVVVVVDATDMHHRYAPPICIADMVRRYARPENRKGQEHMLLAPDVVCFCDSLFYF